MNRTIISAGSFIAIIMIYLLPQNAYSQVREKMRIAVMDLKGEGIQSNTTRVVTNMLRTSLINLKKFTIIERSQMDQIMKEQGFQKTGCTDQDCAVQIGKVLSARKMLIGELSSIGSSLIITVRIVDVERAEAEFAEMEKAQDVNQLDTAVTRLTDKLAVRIYGKDSGKPDEEEREKTPDRIPVAGKTVPGFYLRGIVPGWGQIYVGNTIRGASYMAVFLGTVVYFSYAVYQYNKAHSDYDALGPNNTPAQFSDTYKKYRDSASAAKTSIIIMSCAYALNWIDLLIFSRNDLYQPAVSRTNGLKPAHGPILSFDLNKFRNDTSTENVYSIRFDYSF
jgi:hypothetical protein